MKKQRFKQIIFSTEEYRGYRVTYLQRPDGVLRTVARQLGGIRTEFGEAGDAVASIKRRIDRELDLEEPEPAAWIDQQLGKGLGEEGSKRLMELIRWLDVPDEVIEACKMLGLESAPKHKSEIKAVRKKFAKDHHPDCGGDEALMKRMNHACDVVLAWFDEQNAG